jgi:hypothetical protein
MLSSYEVMVLSHVPCPKYGASTGMNGDGRTSMDGRGWIDEIGWMDNDGRRRTE